MASVGGYTVEEYGSPVVGWYRIPGSDAAIGTRRETAPLVIGFMAEFHALVEPLRREQCGGHNPRPVRGSDPPRWSRHAAAIAADANWLLHPLGARGTFSAAQAATIRALCRKYGLRWGGDYSGRADEMHVEVIVAPDVARALVVVLQAAAAWGEPYTGKPGSRVCARWAVGTDVEALQAHLSLDADGYFGEGTEAGVKTYQASKGLTPDGIVGPVTWAKVLTPPPPPPPPPEPEPTWQEPVDAEPGERTIGAFSVGPDVAWLQTRLGLAADGEFGPGTESAVKVFQAAQSTDADGIVGPVTWERLQLVVLAAGNDVDRRITDGRLAEHHDPGHITILHVEDAIAIAAAGTTVIAIGTPAATALPGVPALAGKTRVGTAALLSEYLAGPS